MQPGLVAGFDSADEARAFDDTFQKITEQLVGGAQRRDCGTVTAGIQNRRNSAHAAAEKWGYLGMLIQYVPCLPAVLVLRRRGVSRPRPLSLQAAQVAVW